MVQPGNLMRELFLEKAWKQVNIVESVDMHPAEDICTPGLINGKGRLVIDCTFRFDFGFIEEADLMKVFIALCLTEEVLNNPEQLK